MHPERRLASEPRLPLQCAIGPLVRLTALVPAIALRLPAPLHHRGHADAVRWSGTTNRGIAAAVHYAD
ncbi:MAG: hypothetical protein HIU89_03880 [Proteobacteria bacterium]|nr:hypothetical protein [Pseudomonadota bacterium]